MFHRMLDPSLMPLPDPLHKPWQYATCDERKGTSCGCQLFGSNTALRCWVFRGREVTCSYAVFPAYSSCKQTIQQNFVDVLLGTGMINYLRPSMRYFDHIFGRTSDSQVVWRNVLEQLEDMLKCCRPCCTSKSQNGSI